MLTSRSGFNLAYCLVTLAACGCVLLAGLFTGAMAASASEGTRSAFSVSARVGFSGTFKLGYWSPVSVTVRNQGRAATVSVEVRTAYGAEFRSGEFHNTYRRTLDLGPGAAKRVDFVVLLESFARPLEVRVTSGGRTLLSHPVDLRGRFTEASLILGLGRNIDLDYLNQPVRRGTRVLYPHPERLPSRWQAYHGVGAVVIRDLGLERLSETQYVALRRWITAGGLLVVSGGPDYQRLRRPRLADLLPARPRALTRAVAADQLARALNVRPRASAISERAGTGAVQSRGPDLVVLSPTAGPDTVVRRSLTPDPGGESLPLVIERRVGRGRVVQLAFDLSALDGWADPGDGAGQRLWQRLVGTGSQVRLFAAQPGQGSDAQLQSANPVTEFMRASGERLPGHALLFAFVALYLSALATLYLLPGSIAGAARWRRHAIWLLPLAALPMAYGLFATGEKGPGGRLLVLATVEPVDASGDALLRMDLGMYSNQDARMRLGFARLAPVLLPAYDSRTEGKATSWEVSSAAPVSVSPVSRQAYVSHVLQAVDATVFAVRAALDGSTEAMTVAVDNDSGVAIGAAALVMNGLVWPLGPVDAAGQAAFALAGDTQVLGKGALEVAVGPARDGQEAQALAAYVLGRYEQQARRDARRPASAYLIGRLDGSLEPLVVTNFVGQREFWFVIVPVADPSGLGATAPAAPPPGSSGPATSNGPPGTQEHL